MLTLLVALAVSQAPVADQPLLPLPAPVEQLTPPPPPPPVVDPLPVFEPEPPPVQASPRSARLLTGPEPRVSTGALVGRVALATGLGAAGVILGVLVGSIFNGSLILAMIAATAFAIGFAVVATAVGAALFGRNFYNDLRAALPVAAIVVGPAVLLAMLAAFLLPAVGTVLLIVLPLAAMIATPLIVQARKPEVDAGVGKDRGPASGPAFTF